METEYVFVRACVKMEIAKVGGKIRLDVDDGRAVVTLTEIQARAVAEALTRRTYLYIDDVDNGSYLRIDTRKEEDETMYNIVEVRSTELQCFDDNDATSLAKRILDACDGDDEEEVE